MSEEGAKKRLDTSRLAPTEFAEGSDGRCLMQALAARRIAFRYLRVDEITNPESLRPVMTFLVNGVPYYFDGWLRSANSSLVPGPPVHGQAAHDFVNDKGAVKTLLRANGFRVPEGAVFARDQYDEAEDFFSTFIAACPAGACMKPTRGGAGKRVFVGVRDVASFWRRFETIASASVMS
jgi:hypothetical protein